MRCVTYIRQIRLAFLLVVFISIGLPSLSEALTYFYVDPSFSGGRNDGSPTNPWTRLDQDAQWDVINNALASDAVTVYFSARIVAYDTAETLTTAVYVKRTDTSTNLLTLDGSSKYNTNDSSGSWANYTGTNKAIIQTACNPIYFNLYGTWTNRNYITIQGFKLISGHCGQTLPSLCGSHLTLTNLEVTQTTTGSTSGGGIGIGYAYDASKINCGSLSNIEISNNTIHNVGGEGIYIGGCANNASCSAAHSNIIISGNTIYDVGVDIGESDGIDIKDGNSNITVSNNTIYMTNVLPKQGDGIVTMSAATVERNFIYNFPRSGIFLDEYYDIVTGFRNGPVVRNNIIVNVGGGSAAEGANGITIYVIDGRDNWSNVKVYNNSIHGVTGHGIRFYSAGTNTTSGHDVRNNAVSNCSLEEFASSAYFTFTAHDYNNYYDTSGNVFRYGPITVAYNGDITAQEAHSKIIPPLFIKTSAPYSAENFKLQSSSLLIDAGVTLTGFSNDYAGTTRPQGSAWDIGAIEALQQELPSAPRNLRIAE
jgi:hypothetical protein